LEPATAVHTFTGGGNMAKAPDHEIQELERRRLKEREKADLEVERNRGPRPLEGFSGGETSWVFEQNDWVAAEEHGDDAARSMEESERQAR
jgi:hypothetical protein